MKFLLRLLKKLSLLDYFNLKGPHPLYNNITVPVIKGVGYDHFFESELWLTDLLKRLISSASNRNSFIDVGVNIGQTLLKLKSINRSVKYFGFEPNPNCLFYLYELIRCNRFEDVTVFPLALSDKCGVTDLILYSGSATDPTASIVLGFRDESSNKIKVPTINNIEGLQFDSISPGIIKIDVEGGELEVIKTLAPVIQNHRPFIVCEVLPVYNAENSFRLTRQHELESILKNLRYKKALIIGLGQIKEIDAIGIHSAIEHVNYIFFPEENKKQLESTINFI